MSTSCTVLLLRSLQYTRKPALRLQHSAALGHANAAAVATTVSVLQNHIIEQHNAFATIGYSKQLKVKL